MPLLDINGFKADAFAGHVAEAGALDQPLSDGANAVRAVFVPNTTTLPQLLPHLAALELIAIAFPAFSDGRGFSLAKQLRNAGFKGVLRARGALIPDQFRQAIACGFDEIELDDERLARQPLDHWLAALGRQSARYQGGFAGMTSVLDQRRAAREKNHAGKSHAG
jgi:uncharacterized protein (DUF934 family)